MNTALSFWDPANCLIESAYIHTYIYPRTPAGSKGERAREEEFVTLHQQQQQHFVSSMYIYIYTLYYTTLYSLHQQQQQHFVSSMYIYIYTLHYTTLYSHLICSTLLWSTRLHCTMLYYAMLFYAMLRYAMRHYITLYYIRRPRQTQGGARQGIRHLTLVSDYYHFYSIL